MEKETEEERAVEKEAREARRKRQQSMEGPEDRERRAAAHARSSGQFEGTLRGEERKRRLRKKSVMGKKLYERLPAITKKKRVEKRKRGEMFWRQERYWKK